MKGRSKGFTLTELLTALVIHSFFILMLGGTFYTLISFGSRSQMVMTARERGQRVIDYIDSRVRNAGLGMWKLESSKEIREALAPLTISAFTRSDMKFPVMITYEYNDEIDKDTIGGDLKEKYDLTSNYDDKGIYCGNVLTLLYAGRDTKKNLTLKNGGYAIMDKDRLDSSTAFNSLGKTNLKNIFSNIRAQIYEYYKETYYNQYYKEALSVYALYENKATKEAQTKVSDKSFYDFWENFLKNYITNRKKKYDADTEKAYKDTFSETGGNNGKAIEAAMLDVVSDDQDCLRSMLKDLQNYVNTDEDANIFIPQVTSVLKKYASNPEFNHKFLAGDNKEIYNASRFSEKKNKTEPDIRSYGVLRGTGPVLVEEDKLEVPTCEPVLSGDELLYLKSIRFFAENPRSTDPDNQRNFKVQKLDDEKWGTNKSKVNPYQTGILELYAELDTNKHVLNVWVLSSGGRDRMTHNRPSNWPEKARWREAGDNDDYKYLVTYVSKGTWRLNNLHKTSEDVIDFKWN